MLKQLSSQKGRRVAYQFINHNREQQLHPYERVTHSLHPQSLKESTKELNIDAFVFNRCTCDHNTSTRQFHSTGWSYFKFINSTGFSTTPSYFLLLETWHKQIRNNKEYSDIYTRYCWVYSWDNFVDRGNNRRLPQGTPYKTTSQSQSARGIFYSSLSKLELHSVVVKMHFIVIHISQDAACEATMNLQLNQMRRRSKQEGKFLIMDSQAF